VGKVQEDQEGMVVGGQEEEEEGLLGYG